MRRQGLVVLAFAVSASTAFAQDYDPSMSAHESMSQQQFNTQQTAIGNHMISQSVRRDRGAGGATSRQRAACRAKSSFRAQFGAGNPKVRRLYSLCRSVGL